MQGPQAIGTVTRLVSDLPAAVYWSWPRSGSVLFNHLRRRSLVEVPRAGRRKTVLFRFADPDVITNVLGVLRPAQLGGFCGEGMILAAASDGRLTYFAAPPDTSPEPGRISLDALQYEAIGTRFSQQLRERAIRQFARHVTGQGDAAATRIGDAFTRAGRYRLTTPGLIWAFIALDLAWGQRFEERPVFAEVQSELAAEGLDPDLRVFLAEQAARRVYASGGPS